MFTGTWKESQQSLIKLEIPDENIDEEGMFCSESLNLLYIKVDDVNIDSDQLVSYYFFVLSRLCSYIQIKPKCW